MSDFQKIVEALEFAEKYGRTDGAHHKAWVIDQMVRALTGADYVEFVRNHDKNNGQQWDCGTPP